MVGFIFARIQNDQRSNGSVDFVSRSVLAITAPFSTSLGRTLDSNSRFWNSVFVSESLRRENERLRAQEASWRLYQTELDILQRRVDDLRRMSGLPQIGQRERVAADVISYDPMTSRMTLSAGSRQGIAPGMAVVTGAGLLGQIQTVETHRSQALLLASPVLRFGAMVNGTPPVTGLIRGQGTRRLLLEIVENNRVFTPGEPVVTSLHSERTPPGILIGFVAEQVQAQDYGLSRIIVIPAVDVARTREVMVIK